MWRVWLGQLFLLYLIFLTVSCSSGSTQEDPVEFNSPNLLLQLENNDDFLSVYKQAYSETLNKSQIESSDTSAVAASSESSASISQNFSTTYKLESAVDEHDLVKNNASHIFIAPSKKACCYVFRNEAAIEPAASSVSENESLLTEKSRGIRILKAEPDTAGISEEAIIEIPEEKSVEGMFLKDNQLMVIDSTAYWGSYGSAFSNAVYDWEKQESGLTLYNIENPKQPQETWQLKSSGAFVDSRLIGDVLYLFLRHSPSVASLDSLNSEELSPITTVNGLQNPSLETKDCYVSNIKHPDFMGTAAYPVFTYVLAIDTQNKQINNQLCFSDDIAGLYVSENNIYFAQHAYTQTDTFAFIHQFSLDAGMDYIGSAKVPGYLYGAAALDFRLSEYRGHLRVVTSQWQNDRRDFIDHHVFILKPKAATKSLETVAQLPNNERPKAIGKPNEDLRGVRFFGPKAYLVTFEQIDPLYVLNLSNPEDPFIAGELEIPGFSDFLHPVSDELLLGIGLDQNNHAKVELFDVSTMNNPLSITSVSLGVDAVYSYTPAQYNRKAFTYLNYDETTDRFAIPLNLTKRVSNASFVEENQLHLFEIKNKNLAASASLDSVGFLSAQANQTAYGTSLMRSIFMKEAVYFINDEKLWSALWQNPDLATGPY